ncbi:MAG: HEAT repeat domain-containing protein, partial [Polyangiaceae bacterium]|nr:HEAT repeat domain-containing protein [Polyangiaceae bacterium]
RSLGRIAAPSCAKLLPPLLRKKSWADVIARGAIDGLSDWDSEAALPYLIKAAAYGQPLRLRRSAIAALGRVGEGKKCRDTLTLLLEDKDPHLRSAAAHALGSMGDPKVTAALQALLQREQNGWVIRSARQAVDSIASASPQESAQKKKLSQLEQELRELKAEVGKLSASAQGAKKKTTSKTTKKKSRRTP